MIKQSYIWFNEILLLGSGNVHVTKETSSAAGLCQPQRKSEGRCLGKGKLSFSLLSQLCTVQGQGNILNGDPFTAELNITERGSLLFSHSSSNSLHWNVGLNAMGTLILKEIDNYFCLHYIPGHFYPSQCALFSFQGHRIELQAAYDSIYQERMCPIYSFIIIFRIAWGLRTMDLNLNQLWRVLGAWS